MADATPTDTHRAIDAIWRIESAKIIAGVARMVRDVGLAEELAHDALVTALEQWPKAGVPDNPGAWLMTAAKNRALDHFRHHKLVERKHEEIGPRYRGAGRVGGAGFRRRARRRHRRRPAAAHFHRVPSGAFARGARRAHAAPARRPDHRRDRTRIPRRRADHRAAHRARQAHARRGARALRSAARRRARGPPGLGARGDLSRLQRRLLGDRGRRLDATAALRRGAASGPHRRRAGAERAGGAWARRADGNPGLARASAHRRGGRADPVARSGPRAMGSAADPPRSRGAERARTRSAAPWGRTRCRPRSPPVMRERAPRTRRIGRASRRSTTRSRSSRRRRWSS